MELAAVAKRWSCARSALPPKKGIGKPRHYYAAWKAGVETYTTDCAYETKWDWALAKQARKDHTLNIISSMSVQFFSLQSQVIWFTELQRVLPV